MSDEKKGVASCKLGAEMAEAAEQCGRKAVRRGERFTTADSLICAAILIAESAKMAGQPVAGALRNVEDVIRQMQALGNSRHN